MQEFYKQGDKVQASGKGKTARWSKYRIYHGTVVSSSDYYVYVRWDGTRYDDQMTYEEVDKEEVSNA